MDNMQLWLSSSTDSINLNDRAEGFYLNPDLEGLTGLPDIRSVNGLNAGYDGGWTATQLWAARLITIRGVIAINDKAAVEDKRKALAKILSQGKDEDLELKFVSEAGNTYTTTVRTSYCTMALQRVFWRQEYQIQLRANDPLIYDDGGSELVAILRVMAGEGGFEIPFGIPFDIGGTVTPTSIDVGDEATYPLIRLKGDLHNPTIISTTTNQRMQVLADIITTTEWRDYTSAYTTNGYKQIGDGLDGSPLSLTNLYGNATQETTTGKNLFSTLDLSTPTIATGLNSIKLVKPATRTVNAYPTMTMPAGTWTISYDVAKSGGNTEGVRCNIYQDNGSGGYEQVLSVNVYTGRVEKTFTLTRNFHHLYFFISTDMPDGATADITNIQIEQNDHATSFEPYTAGASPNPSYPQAVNVVSGAQTVKITGKNLFDWEDSNKSASQNYSSATLNEVLDNGVIITGNASSSPEHAFSRGWYLPTRGTIDVPYRVHLYQASTITVSADITLLELGNTAKMKIFVGDGSTNITNPVGNQNIVLNQKVRLSQTLTDVPAGDWFPIFTLNSNKVKIENMLVQFGSQATSYEPYQSQSQEINLGKNLCGGYSSSFNRTSAYVAFENNADGTIKASGTATGAGAYSINQSQATQYGWVKTLQAGTYSFSLKDAVPSGTTVRVMNHATDAVIATAPQTFTLNDKTDVFISVKVNVGDSIDMTIKPQLERGSQATSYAPYKTPLELAKIGTYQDYIYNDNGTWKIHKEVGKVVLTGGASENWKLYTAPSGAHVFYDDTIKGFALSNNIPFSDNFTGQINVSGGSGVNNGCVAFNMNATTTRLFARYDALFDSSSTVADWLTWLASNPTTVYYALATPTDTEITDSELIAQLNHIYSLYGGQNNLWLIPSGGAQGEMTVSYATAVDRDYHEVVIDCQARTVTQDGRNLYPALADGSEFIRLLPGENKLYLTSEVESDDGTAEVKFKKGNISI